MKKKKKWVRPRHKVVKWLLRGIFALVCRIQYHVKLVPFRKQKGKQFLILMNHQTPFDQFFVSVTFKTPVYFVATEDVFSLGWLSRALRYLVAPIPIKKQTADISAVMNCLRVAKEGGTIALAPEGNRTYTGRTEYMNPAIATLARKLALPVALYRIEGGYGVQPRWANTRRRGRMRAYVSEVITPEEMKEMTDEALLARIRTGLFVDDRREEGAFRHARRAEYLERALYVCPTCGLTRFHSDKNTLTCTSCGMRLTYTEHLTFEGEDGKRPPFADVASFYDYQSEFMGNFDPTAEPDRLFYEDAVALSSVVVCQKKRLIEKRAVARLYGDRITVSAGDVLILSLPFSEISAAAVLGRQKINLYHEKDVWQLVGDVRFCGLKYVNFYYRYRNVVKGEKDGSFLGL